MDTHEDLLSIAQSIVDFMRTAKIQRMNASATAAFRPCSVVGIRPIGGNLPQSLLNKYIFEIFPVTMLSGTRYLDYLFTNTNSFSEQLMMLGLTREKCQEICFWFSTFDNIIQCGNILWQFKGGVCENFSGMVIALLQLLHIPCEKITTTSTKEIQGKKLDHAFVVINRNKSGNLRDINTWGDDFIIIDAWDRFKAVNKKMIFTEPDDNLFFLPQYATNWTWKVALSIDVPQNIFPRNRAMALLTAEYQKIMALVPPEFKQFKPEVRTLTGLAKLVNLAKETTTEEIIKTAIKQGYYDCYRLRVASTSISATNQTELKNLAALIGRGVNRNLIEVKSKYFSINRIWLDHQLSAEKRTELMQKFALA